MKEENIFDILSKADKKLVDLVKEEYNKLSEIDRKDVLNSTNEIVESVCDILGVKDPERYFVSDETFNKAVDKCKNTYGNVKSTYNDVKDKVYETASEVKDNLLTKEEAIDKLNEVMTTTFRKFGLKDPEKFTIKDPDKVYFDVAKPSEGVTLTTASYCSCDPVDSCCSATEKCRCSSEDESEDEPKNSCKCASDDKCYSKNADADNGVDAPVKTNVPRVELNLASTKNTKKNTKKNPYTNNKYKKPEGLAAELKTPASVLKSGTSADGSTYVGANPYANSESARNGIGKNVVLGEIKNRLVQEAKDTAAEENYLTVKAFKETLVSKVTGILEDSNTHNYTVHPKTSKAPAAVEVVLEDVCASIKENICILSEIETELKNLYDFPEVHINILDTDNKDFVTLVVFMVLE